MKLIILFIHSILGAYLERKQISAVLGLTEQDGCWLSSYGRGAGKVIRFCRPDQEKNGALCYPKCNEGYYGLGPVCWENCPEGFRNDGAFCGKPGSYGRGAGYAIWSKNKCNKENSQGCEKNGLMYYPKCKANFHAVGCCVCSPDCPPGQKDIGVSCAKKSYGRTAGTPLICGSDEELSGALCYPPCKDGKKGIGPVCWGQCPANYNACGALCLREKSCIGQIAKYFLDAGKIIKDIATSSPVGAVIDTAKFAAGLVFPICK